jgi:hypothetical protein
MTEAGLSDLALAQRPGMDGEAVHRRRDLLRQSRIAELDAALRVLAKRMVIVMEAAEGRDAGSCSHVCTGIAPPATIDAVFQRHQSLPEQQRNPIVPCDFERGRNRFIAQQFKKSFSKQSTTARANGRQTCEDPISNIDEINLVPGSKILAGHRAGGIVRYRSREKE